MVLFKLLGSVPLHAMIQKGSGDFEIVAGNEIFVTGRLVFPNSGDKFLIDPIEIEIGEENVQLSGSDIYNEFQHRGQKYSGLFKTIKNLTIGEDGKKLKISIQLSLILFNYIFYKYQYPHILL